MTTLADLKKRRTTDFSKLTKALEDANKPNGGDNDDSLFWKLERDKAGNGSATIRFLPAYMGEDAGEADELPFVKVYSHSFQGPTGRWYIENCRSTIGQEDPVNDMNRILWKGSDADKEQAKAQKRKLTYIGQILVISDPKKPENNGKVFFFKFGKKIFDKIMDAAKPTFEDEDPLNVFDLWEGANFKLRIKTVDKYPNYDSSAFDKPTPIAESDEEILEIVKQQKSLAPFVDPSKFKSYEALDKKLKEVLNPNAGSTRRAEDIAQEMREASKPSTPATDDTPPFDMEEKSASKTKAAPVKTPAPAADDDDIADFFNSIGDD